MACENFESWAAVYFVAFQKESKNYFLQWHVSLSLVTTSPTFRARILMTREKIFFNNTEKKFLF